MIKIDAHAHAMRTVFSARLPRSDKTFFNNSVELKKIYDTLNITRGILMPIVSPEGQTSLISNEDVFEISQKNKNTFYWCCNIDPRMGDYNSKTDFSRILLFYKSQSAIGVGELTANLRLDNPMVDNFLYHCGECNMPVTIHWSDLLGQGYGVYAGENMELLRKVLLKYPKLKIVGHSVPFWRLMSCQETYFDKNISRLIYFMRECPNLYCDTSANSGYSAMTKNLDKTYKFIDEFQDRILFGLDISYVGETLYKKIDSFYENAYSEGYISKQSYEKIYYKNAIKLYGLNDF